jgi:serine/threonine-protein kinase RIO1
MDNYEEYLEERIYGMYNIVESFDIVMEKLTKDEKQIKKMSKRKFINYLRTMHSDFKPEEITQAKTQTQRDKVIKKYENDYKQWKKEAHKQFAKDLGIEIGVYTLLDILF